MKQRKIGIMHVVFSASMIEGMPPDAIGAFVPVVLDVESEDNFAEFVHVFHKQLGNGYYEVDLLYTEPLIENLTVERLLQTSISNDLPTSNFAWGSFFCYDDFIGERRTITSAFENVCKYNNITCDESILFSLLQESKRRWICIAHVLPSKHEEYYVPNGLGAFVPVVADAKSKKEFEKVVRSTLEEIMLFSVIEISEMELLTPNRYKALSKDFQDAIDHLLPIFPIAVSSFEHYTAID